MDNHGPVVGQHPIGHRREHRPQPTTRNDLEVFRRPVIRVDRRPRRNGPLDIRRQDHRSRRLRQVARKRQRLIPHHFQQGRRPPTIGSANRGGKFQRGQQCVFLRRPFLRRDPCQPTTRMADCLRPSGWRRLARCNRSTGRLAVRRGPTARPAWRARRTAFRWLSALGRCLPTVRSATTARRRRQRLDGRRARKRDGHQKQPSRAECRRHPVSH